MCKGKSGGKKGKRGCKRILKEGVICGVLSLQFVESKRGVRREKWGGSGKQWGKGAGIKIGVLSRVERGVQNNSGQQKGKEVQKEKRGKGAEQISSVQSNQFCRVKRGRNGKEGAEGKEGCEGKRGCGGKWERKGKEGARRKKGWGYGEQADSRVSIQFCRVKEARRKRGARRKSGVREGKEVRVDLQCGEYSVLLSQKRVQEGKWGVEGMNLQCGEYSVFRSKAECESGKERCCGEGKERCEKEKGGVKGKRGGKGREICGVLRLSFVESKEGCESARVVRERKVGCEKGAREQEQICSVRGHSV